MKDQYRIKPFDVIKNEKKIEIKMNTSKERRDDKNE